ncbi:MAG: DUF4426 domain-containing protein [Proteobacteria bacterium]|nr:DUF4426 domain-containing protein [Pseudomonadota bacterium]
MRTRPFVIMLLSTFLAFPYQATAGGSEDVGDYVIHYNALSTDQLAPAVASAYGVVRSRNRALLNIAITRKEDGTPGVPVEALVNVDATNLSGQVKNVRVRKITEEGESKAIYYIAEINVADGETLIFDVKVTPEDRRQTHTVRFKQQFFVN